MTPPPPYPRTPYLIDDPAPFLRTPCDVEEKLDGANVAIWLDNGQARVMSRGGPDAMDRARQLGRLRAWIGEHEHAVRALCAGDTVIYGEWLWLRHGVPYDRLPDWLVVLDLWQPDTGFRSTAERDVAAHVSGFTTPPVVVRDAILHSLSDAEQLIPGAAWGPSRAEGIVLRRPDGHRAKVVHPHFERRSDAVWARDFAHNEALHGG